MGPELNVSIAVLCDATGVVRYVLHDDLSTEGSLQGRSLADAVCWVEPSRFHAFLDKVREEGLVFGWTLELLVGGEPRALHVVGECVGEVILVIGADSPAQLGPASRALLSSTVVPLSVLFGGATGGAQPTCPMPDWNHLFYAELSRVNNELTNARRELSKRNAELLKANAHLKQEIKDRRRTEEALRKSEKRFRLLAENSRDVIYRIRLSPTLEFEYVNPAVTEVVGFTPEEHYARPQLGLEIVHPEDRPLLEELAESPEFYDGPLILRWVHKDGHVVWTEQRNVPIYDEEGHLVAIEGTAREITERKRAEMALRQEKEFVESLIETAPVIVLVLDTEGQVVRFNPYLETLTGHSLDEVLGRDWFTTFLPESEREASRAVFEGALDDNQTWGNVNSVLTREGATRQIEWYDRTLRDGDGAVVGLLCIGLDVTERLEIERDLRHYRERLEGLVKRRTIDLTRANERLRAEIARRQRAEEALHRYAYELELLNLAGQALTSSLDLDTVLATVLEEVHHLLGVAAASVWLRDSETGELVCRQASGSRHEGVRGIRLAPGQGIAGWVVEHDLSLIVPDVRQDSRYFAGVDEQTGLGLRSLLTVPLQTGEEVIGVLQVVATEVAAFDDDDLRLLEPLAASATIGIENARLFERSRREISERQRAEEALRRSQENYALLVNSIDGIVWEGDPHTFQFTFVSQQAERLLGYPVERWTREPDFWVQHLYPDDRDWALAFCEEMTAAGRGHEFEYRMLAADGRTVWLRDFTTVEMEEGKPVKIRGVMVDVTAHREADEALRRSGQKFRSVVESSYDGVVMVDEEGTIVVWNAGQERITGIERSEAVGRPIWEVQFRLRLPEERAQPRAREVVRRRVLDCLEKGTAPWLNQIADREIERPDGARRLIECLTFPVPTEKGFMIGSVTRDVTERRQKEQALRRYTRRLRALSTRLAEVEEAERKRLARELHDRVGQNLTALGINLNIVQSMVPENAPEAIRSRLMDSLALVEETTERIRNVMADLRPPVLDDYGLVATLHWYAEQFSARTGVPVTVEAEELESRLPPRMEGALFRIVQEALTNVAKHAGATRAEVQMKIRDGWIRLAVVDDGKGFEPGALAGPGEERGWGLITMSERAEALGGHFHLESSPGAGTRVVVEVER